jgi:hypothetical protein
VQGLSTGREYTFAQSILSSVLLTFTPIYIVGGSWLPVSGPTFDGADGERAGLLHLDRGGRRRIAVVGGGSQCHPTLARSAHAFGYELVEGATIGREDGANRMSPLQGFVGAGGIGTQGGGIQPETLSLSFRLVGAIYALG